MSMARKWSAIDNGSLRLPRAFDGGAAPGFRRSTVVTPGREHLAFERMMFPLARDGVTVDMLIGVFVYDIGKRPRGL